MRRFIMAGMIVLICAVTVGCVLSAPATHAAPSGHTSVAAIGLILLDADEGLYVLGVIDGSVAGNAGIRAGDYLTMARETPLSATAQLEELLAHHDGAPLTIALTRQEKTVTVSLSFR